LLMAKPDLVSQLEEEEEGLFLRGCDEEEASAALSLKRARINCGCRDGTCRSSAWDKSFLLPTLMALMPGLA
ncbi:UNVERIFIED_CONTAM: hypothetical protein K2H54_066110, partial [Gekko kuhli]